jgi:ribosome-associated protein
MLIVSNRIRIPKKEIQIRAVRSQGPGGQHVNKVASAVHLRFDILNSSLPEAWKRDLMAQKDNRITREGIVVIKAQTFSSQEKNRQDALQRLTELIRRSTLKKPRRKPTRPSLGSRQKRLDSKTRHSRIKALRKKIV